MIPQRLPFVLAVASLLAASPSHASSWIAGNGAYSVATNWSPSGTPCVEIAPLANTATIDVAGVIVDQDIPLCSVDNLTLGVGATLRLQDASSYGASAATVAGYIAGLGGDLTASNATFVAGGARISAASGSVITLDAVSLDATDVAVSGLPLLSATGAGSELSLSSLASLDAAFDSVNGSVQEHQIVAADGGSVDLSGLASVVLPQDREDRVSFEVSDTASLILDGLASASGGGQAYFAVSNGATLDLPALSALSGGRFFVSGGGQLTANSTAWTVDSATLLNTNYVLVSAVDLGSTLDLSGLTVIDASFNSTNGSVQTHSVTASDGGSVNLSGLTSVVVPVDREDRLAFEVSDSAVLNLDSLAVASGGGQAFFSATDGGSLNLPALSDLSAGRFFATGGGQIVANGASWALDSAALLNNNYALISAADPGSTLDLSGLTSIDASFDSANGSAQTHTIVASGGGSIDLSGLAIVVLPADREDRLWFEVTDTASLNLDSLHTASGGGHALFNVTDGGALTLPALTTLTAGRFFASGGGQIVARDSSWSLNSGNLNNTNYELIVAADPGSSLDLAGMHTLNAGFNSSNGSVQSHAVVASAGATIDLSGIDHIVAPQDAEDLLRFDLADGAALALGPLDSVSNAGRVSVNLNPAGATLILPRGLDAVAQITVVSIADNTVEVTGSLSFAHTDETTFNLEGARVAVVGVQPLTVEVGAADEDTTPTTTPNFGFAQLIVGSAAQTTIARLVDRVDNGNGFSLCSVDGEALYLYGYDAGPEDGLRILNGSTLDLGGNNLYAAVGGVLMHINPLLSPGVPFPWDQGFIVGGSPADSDQDGVVDAADNCVLAANPDQADSDGDGYGNACDADLNGDLSVNSVDLGQLRLAFFSSPGAPNWNPNADFNGDGFVNPIDLGIMRALFFAPPGPSCVAAP